MASCNTTIRKRQGHKRNDSCRNHKDQKRLGRGWLWLHAQSKASPYFLVFAFETVLARGAPKPKVAQDSVKQFRWVPRSEVSQLELLPGTDKFLECLERLDRASFDEAQLLIRLERRSKGKTTDYWELQCGYDLWGDFSAVRKPQRETRRAQHSGAHSMIRTAGGFGAQCRCFYERIRS